ncbi:hypothetical protein ACLEIY_01285 [Acetobacter tropicalis]|nr:MULTISPECIES: hypothetical protein [Acetobacter]MCP1195074.1 hypothetical protein [Acetobacter senegalensis]
MPVKTAQFQTLSWIIEGTVYELRREGEMVALYSGGSRLFGMTVAEWTILFETMNVFGRAQAPQADAKSHLSVCSVVTGSSSGVSAKPANMGARWTEDHDRELAALWFRGNTLEQTGAEIGRTAPSVASRLVALDIEADIESVYVENRMRRNKNTAPVV